MNYLVKLALRNLAKHKEIGFFNILGLSIALTSALLICSWIYFESSYDNFHSKHERIFRFTVEQKVNGIFDKHYARTWQKWKDHLHSFFPEIEYQTMIRPMESVVIEVDDHFFAEKKSFMVDSNLTKVFDLDFIYGSKTGSFEPGSGVILSQSLAEKYFGKTNPVGKPITIKTNSLLHETIRTITGVVKDLPENSHFHIDLYYPYSETERNTGYSDWAFTYVLFQKAIDISAIISKNESFKEQYIPENERSNVTLHFQPIGDIHLSSKKGREIESNGNGKYVHISIGILLALLSISLINYVNLNAGIFQKRIKQMAVNNLYGSNNFTAWKSVFIESLLLTCIVAIVSIIASLLLFHFLDSNSYFVFPQFSHIPIWLPISIVGSFILTATIFGTLPAILNPYSLTEILSGTKHKMKISVTNKFLLGAQFTISIALIASSILIYKQNDYLKSKSFLSEEESIFYIETDQNKVGPRLSEFEHALKQIPEVLDFTYMMEPPTDEFNDAFSIKLPINKKGENIHVCPVSESFNNFYHMQFLAGENFPKYNETLKQDHYIINESAVKWFGFNSAEDAVGKYIEFDFFVEDVMYKGPIAGVIKDFHIQTLHNPIKPIVFFQKPIWYHTLHIKAKSDNKQKAVQKVKTAWQKVYPAIPFNYTFLDDLYTQAYKKETLNSILLQLFSAVGILVSCIGLLGSIRLSIDSKTKEIGIRKVNGARSYELLIMFNKEFLLWIGGAFIIACPFAFLFMNDWLNDFAYKTTISWWIFALAGITAVNLAIITISWQTWKTAKSNPVSALRYE